VKRALFGLAAALVGLSGGMSGIQGIAHAAGSTPVTCGSTITAPGEYYLAADCGGPGITIAGNNVHLKLNGHTMTGTSTAYGIQVGSEQNVGIEGPGTITQYGTGILIDNSSRVHIWKVNLTDEVTYAIQERNSTNNQLNNNTISLTASGIDVTSGSSDHLTNNSLSQSGMELDYSTNESVTNNDISGSACCGIGMTGSSNNHIDGNTTNNNGLVGIVLTNSTGNELHGNTAYGNGLVDLFDDSPDCDHNNWNGNHFGTTDQPQCIS
jgi:parallel beta-helix repeat protein